MPVDNRSGVRRWLPTDKSLPLCVPMLRNLEAVNITYDGGWHLLSSTVLGCLIDLMRRPSLVHVRVPDHIPRSIFNLALAPNVKHLVLTNLENDEEAEYHVRCPNQPTAPVNLESLYIFRPLVVLVSAPDSRVSISNLRKLVVHSDFVEDHPAIFYLLQVCLDTLEDFEIDPTHHGMLISFLISEAVVSY